MGGVPVSFMHTELNAQLIAYLKRFGVRGGLTAVRKAQLRVGAFFVRAVIEAERSGYPFPCAVLAVSSLELRNLIKRVPSWAACGKVGCYEGF